MIAAETGLDMAHPERGETAQGSGTGSLHAGGLKATLPRLKVLQIFRESGRRHLSAEDVFKTLLVEGSDIRLATVYRVLMQFVQARLLERQGSKATRPSSS